jgi:NDP-sugar pyrophosphorylase family protein
VRRALLRGGNLSDKAKEIVNRNPVCIASKSLANSRLLARKSSVSQIILGKIGSPPKGIYISDDNHLPTKTPPVLIMAGGLGSRLGSLTKKTPKPLISVGGEPIIHRILHSLAGFGFQEVFISVNYLAEQIVASVADGSSFGLKVRYVFEDEPLGTAGAIGRIQDLENFDSLIVMNADLVVDLDYSKLLEYHSEKGFDLTVVARENVTQIPFGVLRVENGLVIGIDEKPSYADFISAGVYVLSRNIFGIIPDIAIDMPDLVNEAAASEYKIGAFPIHLHWIDIGNPQDLDRAEQHFGAKS